MRTVPVTLAALLLASPLAWAWSSNGHHEPDTLRDVNDGWMFPTANTGTTEMVYFNGFFRQYPAGTVAGGTANPNVAAARTSFYTAAMMSIAVLGAWRDCNGDGVIGLAEHGLSEYSSRLLLDASRCPASPIPSDATNPQLCGAVRCPPKDWYPSHNDGQWVRELIPIAWRDVQFALGHDRNYFNANDNLARVWMDVGLPETIPAGTRGCWILPHPGGTYHSVGGLLHTFDCYVGYRGTDTINSLLPDNMDFSDHPRDQYNSRGTLNVKNPWGEEEDPSAIEAWDCSQPQLYRHPNAVRPGTYLNVSRPRVPPSATFPSGWTLSGTMNATGSGFDTCTRNTDGNGRWPYPLYGGSTTNQNGHWGRALAQLPYAMEGNVFTCAFVCQPSRNLFPIEQARPANPYATVLGPSAPMGAGILNLAPGAGTDLFMDGVWVDNTVAAAPPWVDLTTQGLGGVLNVTWYAYIDPARVTAYRLVMPKGTTTGTYGEFQCGADIGTDVVRNRWYCSASRWYINAEGENKIPRNSRLGRDPTLDAGIPCEEDNDPNLGCLPFGAVVGRPYNLRDIDCVDMSAQGLRQAGAHVGVLTGTRCIPAP